MPLKLKVRKERVASADGTDFQEEDSKSYSRISKGLAPSPPLERENRIILMADY